MMKLLQKYFSATIFVAICCLPSITSLADMTPSRHLGENKRTGYVDATLPEQPVLQWVYLEQHSPRHAWREPNREVQ